MQPSPQESRVELVQTYVTCSSVSSIQIKSNTVTPNPGEILMHETISGKQALNMTSKCNTLSD